MTIQRHILRFAAVAALTGLAAGCDGSEVSVPRIRGDYSGSFTYVVNDQPYQESWTVMLDEGQDGTVFGSGSQGSEPVEVTGSHDHPDVSLDFLSDNDGYIGTLAGSVTDDGTLIEGRYNFSIVFVDIPVSLRKTSQ